MTVVSVHAVVSGSVQAGLLRATYVARCLCGWQSGVAFSEASAHDALLAHSVHYSVALPTEVRRVASPG